MNETVTKLQENNSDLYQSESCVRICEGLEIVNNVKIAFETVQVRSSDFQ